MSEQKKPESKSVSISVPTGNIFAVPAQNQPPKK